MSHLGINSELKTEIRLVLVADETEFYTERILINEIIYPILKQYYQLEYDCDFILLDPYYDNQCSELPEINKSDFITQQIPSASSISMGTSLLILAGESYGTIKPPSSLQSNQFTAILEALQKNKNPSWIIFNSKYNKDPNSDYYNLDKNISKDEMIGITNSIYGVMEIINRSKDKEMLELFPSKFEYDHLRSDILKALEFCTKSESIMAKTQIIHRIDKSDNQEVEIETPFQKKCRESYQISLKDIRKKYGTEIFNQYTIQNRLSDELKSTENKIELEKLSNNRDNFLNLKKCRSLAKDLRNNTQLSVYHEIFLEHVMKLIIESCNKHLQQRSIKHFSLNEEIYQSNNSMNHDKIEKFMAQQITNERQREFGILENYIANKSAKMPGLLYGLPGIGKTDLLFRLADQISKSKPNHLIITRKCGTTLTSSNLQLIISSITQQITLGFTKKSTKLSSNSATSHVDYATVIYNFWTALAKATANKNIIILLDNVDILYPNSHTDLVKWLPHSLPNFVKIILTSSSESFFIGFRKRYDESNIITIPNTDTKELIKSIPQLFNEINIDIETQIPSNIKEQAVYCLEQNSNPLYLKLLTITLDSISNESKLKPEIKEITKLYIQKLEQLNHKVFVKHILSYIALSRFGLTLTDINNLFNLDNKILDIVKFNSSSQNSYKCSSYIILHFLNEMIEFFNIIQIENRLVYQFKHPQCKLAVIEHYQLLNEENKSFFHNSFEYWLSKYENDKLKSVFDKFDEESNDETINNLKDNSSLYIKRFVTPQPFYFIDKLKNITSNKRKISELTNLLIKFNRTNDLYKVNLFNYDYLFSVINSYDINHLISEIYFTRSVYEIKNNDEVELLIAQLRVLSSEIAKDARLLAPELSGRLSHLVTNTSMMGQLLVTIDNYSPKTNVLFAAIPCFTSINMDNLRIDLSKDTVILFATLSFDNRFLITNHLEISTQNYFITIWDAKTVTKSQIVNIGSFENDTKLLDMCLMPQRDDNVILKFEDKLQTGFIVVNLELSTIENVIKLPRAAQINIEYLSKNHLYLKVNNELQILTFPQGHKDHTMTRYQWPTLYTPNDRFLIGPKPANKKDIGKNVNFNLRVLNGGSGDMVSQLLLPYNACTMKANPRNELIYVSTKIFGLIYRYDISQISKKDAKKLKNNLELNFKTQPLFMETSYNLVVDKYFPNVYGHTLKLSVDEKYLIVEYIVGGSIKFGGVWNISSKILLVFVQLDWSTNLEFSTDGDFAFYLDKDSKLNVYQLQSSTTSAKCTSIQFNEAPIHVAMLRSRSLVITFQSALLLTTLATLQSPENHQLDQAPLHEYCTSLLQPKVNSVSGVVYSNLRTTNDFQYYKLSTNKLYQLDLSCHSNKSLTKYPTDRLLSPDGSKLVVMYGFQAFEQCQQDQQALSWEELMLQQDLITGLLVRSCRDLRKPQIPAENYFIGSQNDDTENVFRDAYKQSIIKIIDLKTQSNLLQISLVGEKILNLTNDLLLTFKPDYASLGHTKTSNSDSDVYDVISIYSIPDTKYQSSLYLEHPVIQSILLDENQATAANQNKEFNLLVCCGYNGKFIKILTGHNFQKTLLQLDIQVLLKYYDEMGRNTKVTAIHPIRKYPSNFVLVQYSVIDSNTGLVKQEKDRYYAKIDMVKKDVLCQFSTSGLVCDLTRDGTLLIDSLLNIYDLTKSAQIIRQIKPVISLDNCQIGLCNARFSLDNEFIIIYEPMNNQLWIIKNDESCLVIGRSLLTTVTKKRSNGDNDVNANMISNKYQMSLGDNGKYLIMYNDLEFKVFLLKIKATNKLPAPYKSPTDRIGKLIFSVAK